MLNCKYTTQVLFILILLSSITYGQNAKLDSLIKIGIDNIYNINFTRADSIFTKLAIEHPKFPAGKFFKAMNLWWQILLDFNNSSLDDEYYALLDEVVELCDDILDENSESIDAYFFKGGALGFRARLLAIREEWLDAALDGKEALPLVFNAYNIDSTNVDVQLGFGIYNYYAAVIPENFEFVKPLMIFFPEGNKEKGLQQLTLASQKGKFSRTEAKYFLMTSLYRFEKNYTKALKLAKELFIQYPNNPVFEKYIGRIYVRMGNYLEASKIFYSILEKFNNGKEGYNKLFAREAYYYIGSYYSSKNENEQAIKYFQKCEKLSSQIDLDEESGFWINSTLTLGLLNEKIGDIDQATTQFEKVLDMREYRNAQEKAEKHLEKLKRKN